MLFGEKEHFFFLELSDQAMDLCILWTVGPYPLTTNYTSSTASIFNSDIFSLPRSPRSLRLSLLLFYFLLTLRLKPGRQVEPEPSRTQLFPYHQTSENKSDNKKITAFNLLDSISPSPSLSHTSSVTCLHTHKLSTIWFYPIANLLMVPEQLCS